MFSFGQNIFFKRIFFQKAKCTKIFSILSPTTLEIIFPTQGLKLPLANLIKKELKL